MWGGQFCPQPPFQAAWCWLPDPHGRLKAGSGQDWPPHEEYNLVLGEVET
jgi:hypothetical protein